jgi:hypothetical protein
MNEIIEKLIECKRLATIKRGESPVESLYNKIIEKMLNREVIPEIYKYGIKAYIEQFLDDLDGLSEHTWFLMTFNEVLVLYQYETEPESELKIFNYAGERYKTTFVDVNYILDTDLELFA